MASDWLWRTQAESLERDVATRAERIAELEEKLRAEIVAGEDRAQSYRDDLEAAASRVDSLAGKTVAGLSSPASRRDLSRCSTI
jgi:hypothetical protein|eukprot:COSAG02_NODE_8931_length_2395_cov_2.478223_4_plen_84_part_00